MPRLPEGVPGPAGSGEPPPQDPPLAVQLALSRAADLARAARYEEAERLLAGLRISPRQAVPVLHLLARIRAQAGYVEEAADAWRRVLQLNADHEGARAGLEEIRRLRRRPVWLGAFLSWPVAAAVLLGAALVALRRCPPSPGAAGDLREALEGLAAEQRELARQVRDLRAARRPAPEIDLGGVAASAAASGEDLVIRFAAGLFDVGSAELKPEARAILAEVGERLRPLAGKVSVTATGFAVEPQSDPALGEKRASAAVAILRSNPALASVPFVVAAGGDPPYPKDDPANVPRNHTVVLRLSHVMR